MNRVPVDAPGRHGLAEPDSSDPIVANRRRLADWCESNVAGFEGPLRLKKFTVGQSNPTYLIEATSGRYVLRRKPSGDLLRSAHAVDREFRVMSALEHTDVPVPRVYALCRREDVIGTMFFVMEYIDARVFLDPTLPRLAPDQRRSLYEQQVEVLARLARLDPAAVGLSNYGGKGNYLQRQVGRWTKQYRASETETIPAMEHLIEWLPTHLPDDDGRIALVHGDFRLDNLLVHPKGLEIRAVVDWELSTLGHPFVDFSYWSTMLRLPRTTHHKGLAGIDRQQLGIPDEDELLQLYLELTASEVPGSWPFWLAFHSFRFAAIAQGVMKRHLDGNASSPLACEVGRMARPVAELGWTAAVQN